MCLSIKAHVVFYFNLTDTRPELKHKNLYSSLDQGDSKLRIELSLKNVHRSIIRTEKLLIFIERISINSTLLVGYIKNVLEMWKLTSINCLANAALTKQQFCFISLLLSDITGRHLENGAKH